MAIHDVPKRYENAFTPEVTAILLQYFIHEDKLSMDKALNKIDALEKYIRSYS